MGPISTSLHPGNTAPFEKMSQRWQAVGNTVSDLTLYDLNLGPPAPETNALLLDQLAGILKIIQTNILHGWYTYHTQLCVIISRPYNTNQHSLAGAQNVYECESLK